MSDQTGRVSGVPGTSLPQARVPTPSEAAVVGAAAVRRVVTAGAVPPGTSPTSALQGSVEALIRAYAPPGMTAEQISEAARRVVAQQGLAAQVQAALAAHEAREQRPVGTSDAEVPEAPAVDTHL